MTDSSMKVRTADVDIIFKLQFLHVLHGETVFLILYILYIHSCGGQALFDFFKKFDSTSLL